MLANLAHRLIAVLPARSTCHYCAIRLVEERSERVSVRQDVVQPVQAGLDIGAMVTVLHDGGFAYAATSDLSESGLRAAVERARHWAASTARRAVDYRGLSFEHSRGAYRTPVQRPWESLGLSAKIELLASHSKSLKHGRPGAEAIVDWEAALWRVQQHTLLVTNGDGHLEQQIDVVAPRLSVTANRGAETQSRTLGFFDRSQQGGLEVIDRAQLAERAVTLGDEALQLLAAPNCPTGVMDLVLAPDQMMLQIHESIGHPLELDRILGDERNYAGTSFVTLDMFGSYRYGSELLNVTFDPTLPHEHASYGFDDDGVPAHKTHIIRAGILERPLGSAVSQARAAVAGTANARATSWNRPPIDRMANLNVEPGTANAAALIGDIERGILLNTNCSWSIDDSRNKFQFGCEKGQLIEDGELKGVVKNPNYRGISATFWRNLTGVGDASTFEVLGVPFCGKGEPNQVIRVGHASPTCRFANVDVFGGE